MFGLDQLHPVAQALAGTLFTWLMTALGAGTVFLSREPSRRFLDLMLGFAAGVMIAASYWSLLAPAISMSEDLETLPAWFPAAVGFMAGGGFLRLIDRFLPHLHLESVTPEGVKTSLHRSILLILAITLHNIPEGLAVGVAFGAVAASGPDVGASLSGAVALALGIGIQNLPEGMAVAVPLRREGLSRLKSFWYGQLSGLVEPVAGVLGALAVFYAKPMLPYALSFAAGAMIFVVIEEVIPESQASGNSDLATMGALVGFTIMMILDVALG